MKRFIFFSLFILAFSSQSLASFAAPNALNVKSPDITELRLRHSEGNPYTTGKEYAATFFWNGAAVLEGRIGIQHLGVFAGRISQARFQQLARLLMDAKFFDLDDAYYPTQAGIIEIDVVRSGQRKRIGMWKNAGPKSLQKPYAALRVEVERTKWKFQRKLPPLNRPMRSAPRKADNNVTFRTQLVPNLRGVAMAGPISPVEREGEPNEKPLAETVITIQPDGGGKEIIRTRADKEGRFEFVLNPGTYLLVPLGPQASDVAPEENEPDNSSKKKSMLPRGEPRTIVIEAGKITEVVVHYDTGIR